jgi:hypothetical protein
MEIIGAAVSELEVGMLFADGAKFVAGGAFGRLRWPAAADSFCKAPGSERSCGDKGVSGSLRLEFFVGR